MVKSILILELEEFDLISLLSRLFIKNRKDLSDAKVRNSYGILCSVFGIFLNLLLFAIKIFAGTVSGSVAITADAINNLSDAGSSIVTLLGFKIAAKKPDKDHPFGHGRSEYIAGLIVSFLIVHMGFELLRSSFAKILSPADISISYVSIVILSVSIAIKLYMAFYNRIIGKRINSTSMRATGADSISDALSTSVVLVSMLIFRFFEVNIDAYCGVFVSLFIFVAGIRSATETISPLLGQLADPDTVKKIEGIVNSYPETLGIHDLIVHDYGGGKIIASLHVEVDASSDMVEMHDAIDNMEREICEKICCIATIHMDPIITNDKELIDVKEEIVRFLGTKYPSVMTHDFRMVRGETHTNIIFDAVVPFDINDEAVTEDLKRAINEYNSKYFAVINVDRHFS